MTSCQCKRTGPFPFTRSAQLSQRAPTCSLMLTLPVPLNLHSSIGTLLLQPWRTWSRSCRESERALDAGEPCRDGRGVNPRSPSGLAASLRV